MQVNQLFAVADPNVFADLLRARGSCDWSGGHAQDWVQCFVALYRSKHVGWSCLEMGCVTRVGCLVCSEQAIGV
jgi:hypothetical protein